MAHSAAQGVDLDRFGESMASIARLIGSAEGDARFKVLSAELARLCSFDNLIIYLFNGASVPELLGSNLPEKRLREQMTDFNDGLFLLDPFVIEAQRGASGVLRLRDIMPDDFFESEFYRHHYTYTNVRDEVRFIVPLDHARVIHVFVEREMRSALFSDDEFGLLKAFWPIVDLYVKKRRRRLDEAGREADEPRVAIDIATRIRAMGDITSRECQVVELILRGHATKSVARVLNIEAGTVTNHKRNIYAKLDVHSQAQLFELFLRTIASI
jgi:DNA-binding CsgD family transcriptional regulator